MSIFETSVPDPLGLWDSAPQTLSFGLDESGSASPSPVVPVYKLNLPADLEASNAAFRSSENALEQVNAALESLPARFDGLAARNGRGVVSFDVTAPESEMFSLLAAIDGAVGQQKAGSPVNFGLNDEVSAALGAAKSQFESFLMQIERDILNFAWVETNVAGQQIARTAVAWRGDAQTVWSEGLSPEQTALHQQALQFATRTRNLRLRLFATVTGGAAKMAGLLATPGGAVLALPVVYQYVCQVLAQARELQAIQN